jgi:outer membrane murein-binding lipoprotein Lpp
MVCKSCRVAGAMNNRGRDQLAKDRSDLAAQSFDAARNYHDECRGCDCQHVVGERLHD